MAIAPAGAYTIEEIPNVHVADRTQYVSNPDGVLKQATVDSLNRSIAHIWQSSTAEVVAVVVNSIGDTDIDDYATALFRKWGIGKKDNNNGVLVLVSTGQRRAVIRSGYGAEGILPDIICSRIIRNDMVPHFKEGDYDSGMLAATSHIDSLLTTPGAIDELKSKYANDRKQESQNHFYAFLLFASVLGLIMLVYVLKIVISEKNTSVRYARLQKVKLLCACFTFATLGGALPALVVLLLAQYWCRNKTKRCPNCKSKMKKLSETDDNNYLTPSQDMEEQLKSVDYDVWLCPTCNATDIYAFPNSQTPYVDCPQCRAKAAWLVSDQVVMQASTLHEGQGVRTYRCRNCNCVVPVRYSIPKLAAPVIVPMGGGHFGGGGGGFSGGSFGGGSTGGGGASGGW